MRDKGEKMEKQRVRKKGQRQRAEEMKKKVTTLEGKESLEGRGKESERETQGQTNGERTREEGDDAISQGGPQPCFHPPFRNS